MTPVKRPHLPVLLLAAAGVALLVRRRWPGGVFVTTAGLGLAYYAAGNPDGPGVLGLLIAIYTVAVQGDDGRSLPVVTAGIVVLGLGWLLAAETLARAERAEQTREQEARRRVDAERLRIAREVHDTVAHAIAVINVQAGVTAHLLEQRPEQVREALGMIEQTSARALGELRATLGVLRDVDQGRAPAAGLDRVEELVELAREAGLDVKVEVASRPRKLPPVLDQAAYRILQEAVTNVLRHAGPARVAVSVTYGRDALVLRVADDGHGSGDGDHGAGQGIVGMRERAALLGGSLTAGPRPGGGFQVLARLPLQPGRGADP